MFDLKKKALGGIKGMLEDRMAKRIAPPSAPEESPQEEAGETPSMEASENEVDGVQLPPGADVSKLSPEERQQLEQLYAKMGC